MSDYSELKRLAEAAKNDFGDYVALNDYGMAVTPTAVLALIAENDRLERKNANQAETIREYSDLVMGGDVSLGMLRADLRVTSGERDQLKAENEALRKLATELRGCVGCENVHHNKHELHEADEPCKVLARIDAAMSKEPHP